jgi:hypothetical protein
MPPTSPNPGFVSLQQYLDANRDTLGQMTRTLGDAGAQKADAARGEADQVGKAAYADAASTGKAAGSSAQGYGQAQTDALGANAYLKNLGSYGGLYTDVGEVYGSHGTYTQGDRAFDAQLLGTSQPQAQFKAEQSKYGDLSQYLQNAANSQATAGAADYKPPRVTAPGEDLPEPYPRQPQTPGGFTPGETPGNVKNDPWGRRQTRAGFANSSPFSNRNGRL